MRRPPTRLTLQPLEDRWTPAAGDLDLSFGTQGLYRFGAGAFTNTSSFPQTNLIAAMPDGRVVTAGVAPDLGLNGVRSASRVVVTRITPDGRTDNSFGTNGAAGLPFSELTTILVQPDGKVLVVGTAQVVNLNFPNTNSFELARLNADGSLDRGFGDNSFGSIFVDSGRARVITLRPDGRILVAGSAGSGNTGNLTNPATPVTGSQGFAVAQFTADGRPDRDFGDRGVSVVRFPVNTLDRASADAITVQPDGKVLLAGTASVGNSINPTQTGSNTQVFDQEFAITRLTADGRLDNGFGDGGRARVRLRPTAFRPDTASAVQVRPDSRIAVAGIASPGTGFVGTASRAGVVAVLTPDGRLDTRYDGDGLAFTPGVTDSLQFPASLTGTFQPDGRAIFLTESGFVRLDSNGQFDGAFGDRGGVNFAGLGPRGQFPNAVVQNFATRPDGTVVVTGRTTSDQFNPSSPVVFRLLGDGPVSFASATPGTLLVGGPQDGSVTSLATNAGQYAASGRSLLYPNNPGTARTATADVNGDGVADYVTGPGPGGGPNVVVTDGKTGARLADLNAFETTFTGGVFVAVADLNGDGKAEVVVTPDQGGGPVVVIYDGAGLAAGRNEAAQLTRFFGIEDAAFRGGARPALGDVNGDGRADLLVAAGFGGGPRVALFDGRAALTPVAGTLPPKLVGDFFIFEPTLRNGVFVTSGDLTGDGRAEVVVGGGPGGGPRVTALDGNSLLAGRQDQVVNFFAGDSADRGGVRVAVRPAGDGTAQLVTGSGQGQAGRVNVYRAATARAGGAADQTLSPFGDGLLADGVYVG